LASRTSMSRRKLDAYFKGIDSLRKKVNIRRREVTRRGAIKKKKGVDVAYQITAPPPKW
jgi:hypothetical protein